MQDGSATETPELVERARFKILKQDGSVDQTLEVHFNPESLEYTVRNNIKQQGNSNRRKQYVSKSSGKLSMDLVFDTTTTGEDVRKYTELLQKAMEPSPSGRKRVARVVRFEWGLYKLDGIIESFKETIDFFAPGGIPLRAGVRLELTQQEGLFSAGNTDATTGVDGALSTGGGAAVPPANAPPVPAEEDSDVGRSTGADPRTAREIGALNGLENLRIPGALSLDVPDLELLEAAAFNPGLALGAGFGISGGAGFGISGGAGFGISGGAGFGISGGAGFGISGGAGFGISGGAGFGISGGAGFGISGGTGFDISGGAGFDISGGAGFDISGGASFGLSGGASFDISGGASFGFEGAANFGLSGGAGFGFEGTASFGVSGGASFGFESSASFGFTSGGSGLSHRDTDPRHALTAHNAPSPSAGIIASSVNALPAAASLMPTRPRSPSERARWIADQSEPGAPGQPSAPAAPIAPPRPAPRGPRAGGRASANVPASAAAFAGLRAPQTGGFSTVARSPRRIAPPARPSTNISGTTDAVASFEIGGRAVTREPAGFRADVGQRATLTSRLRFDEEG